MSDPLVERHLADIRTQAERQAVLYVERQLAAVQAVMLTHGIPAEGIARVDRQAEAEARSKRVER